MTYTEAYRHFLVVLRDDPRMPPPPLRMDTTDEFHTWKSEMRAFDAARIELKLATPREIQAENSAVGVNAGPWRIVEHARFI
ncbi:MAG: hypothetical protein Q8N18_20210 [Opitutaceae bacterium]|nr:hypothetical protein [Opitutaceae bacterium]